MDFRNVMETFHIPEKVLGDICYCQKHFKMVLKVYSALKDQLEQSRNISNGEFIRQEGILKPKQTELEHLLVLIDREQQKQLTILRGLLKQFLDNIRKTKPDIIIDEDIANGIVGGQIAFNTQTNYSTLEPSHVKRFPTIKQLEDTFIKPIALIQNSMGKVREPPQKSLLKPAEERMKRTVRKKSVSQPLPTKVQSATTKVQSASEPSKVQTAAASSSLLKSRMNLQLALGKVKSGKTEPKKGDAVDTDEETSKAEEERLKSSFMVPVKKTRSKPTSSRNSSDSRRSVTPEDIDGASMQHVILPKEEPEPEITDQLSFLSVLGLVTHDFAKKMKEKRTTRKRRNVKSSEKNDFHYGRIDINEFERDYRRLHNKKPILFSPESKLQKRKLEETKPLPQPPIKKLNLSSAPKLVLVPKAYPGPKPSTAPKSNSPPLKPDSTPRPKQNLVGCNVCGKYGKDLHDCKFCKGKFHSYHHVNVKKFVRFVKLCETVCPGCLKLLVQKKCKAKGADYVKLEKTLASKPEIEFVNC